MTEEEVKMTVNDVPDPIAELRAMLKEQQTIIVKQNEAIKSLTARMNENEKLVSASPSSSEKTKEPEVNPQDIAYKAMLKEMGIDKEE